MAKEVESRDSLKTMFIGLLFVFFFFLTLAIYKRSDILAESFRVRGNADQNKPKISFCLFYTDWCPHCQTTKPEWEKLMKNWEMTKRQMYWENNRLTYQDIRIEKVNCEKDNKTCKDFDIQGYPTIVLTIGDKNIEYNGDSHSHGDLMRFLETKLQENGVKYN